MPASNTRRNVGIELWREICEERWKAFLKKLVRKGKEGRSVVNLPGTGANRPISKKLAAETQKYAIKSS